MFQSVEIEFALFQSVLHSINLTRIFFVVVTSFRPFIKLHFLDPKLSKYFLIAENLILDAMHDFLEGVIPFMIKLLLKELISLPGFIPEL